MNKISNNELIKISKEYVENHPEYFPNGFIENTYYPKVNEILASEIGEYYDNAPDYDVDNEIYTLECYKQLKIEIMHQYEILVKNGFKFTPFIEDEDNYNKLTDIYEDVKKNKHLKFFIGGILPKVHPLSELTNIFLKGYRLNYNDLFRITHDIYGHCKHNASFGPRGEEYAYRQHYLMFSEKARESVSTETRGQNSWVNFHEKAKLNKTKPGSIYAVQKVIILPKEYQVLYD